MATTPHENGGTTFSFDGDFITVTNISYSLTDPTADNTIDVSHLGLTTGASALTMNRPLKGAAGDTGREVTIEYLGKDVFNDGATGTLVINANGTSLLSAAATVASSTLTFATNDVVKGVATFKVARV